MKNTVYMTVGLPASGKSTWARDTFKMNPGQYVLVSKDELRDMLHCGLWTPDNEKFIIKMRDAIILAALDDKKDVILHDTNFGKNVQHVTNLVEDKAIVQVVDFTHVSLEECVARDAKRGDKMVGSAIITKMHKQFLYKEPKKPDYIPNAPTVVICDLDGTLALFGNKNPYNRDFENDQLNPVVDSILVDSILQGRGIVFVSGRSEKFRAKTSEFLCNHGYEGFPLFMRKDGDNRDDRIVKEEIYENEIKGHYNVLFVLDDRNRVVKLWRQLGLTCLQVAEGDF